MGIRILLFFFATFLFSCNTIKQKKTLAQKLPELGTIGVYKDYLIADVEETKTIPSLVEPVRVKIEELTISERNWFVKKDSLAVDKEKITLLKISILDHFSLIQQFNKDKTLRNYLSSIDNIKLVSEVVISFPNNILESIRNSDEAYLVQNKEKTLSVQLRKANKVLKVIEFEEGVIAQFKASSFCWGSNQGQRIQIVDLISPGAKCNNNSYRSAQRAKRKAEFKFQ